MDPQLAWSGIAGALGGVNQELQSHDQEEQRLKQAELRGQIQQMIAQLRDEGQSARNAATNTTRSDIADKTNATRSDIADKTNATRSDIADLNNTTRSNIAGDRLKFSFANMGNRRDIADQAEAGRNTRWATPSGNTNLLETGRNTRWATPSGNATLGANVTQRGQDMSQATATRGQDVTFGVGMDRNSINRTRAATADEIARARAALINPSGWGKSDGQPAPGADATAVAPDDQPGGAVPSSPAPAAAPRTLSPIPVTPRVTAPARASTAPVGPRPAAKPRNPALDAVTQKGAALLASYNAERDPQKKAALAQQLRAVQAEIRAAQGKQ